MFSECFLKWLWPIEELADLLVFLMTMVRPCPWLPGEPVNPLQTTRVPRDRGMAGRVANPRGTKNHQKLAF